MIRASNRAEKKLFSDGQIHPTIQQSSLEQYAKYGPFQNSAYNLTYAYSWLPFSRFERQRLKLFSFSSSFSSKNSKNVDYRHQGKQHWVQCLQIALFWISTRTELGQRRKRVMDTLIVPQVFVAAASCNEWPPLPPLRPPFGSCLKGGFTRGNCSSQGTGGLYDWSITHMRSNYLTIPIYE